MGPSLLLTGWFRVRRRLPGTRMGVGWACVQNQLRVRGSVKSVALPTGWAGGTLCVSGPLELPQLPGPGVAGGRLFGKGGGEKSRLY